MRRVWFTILVCYIGCAPAGKSPELYPLVPLETIAVGKWPRPRAEVQGTVKLVRKEADGDTHIRLEDGDHVLILEEIPELRLKTLPKVGDQIKARGIVRHDGEHNWYELHPLVSWELVGAK